MKRLSKFICVVLAIVLGLSTIPLNVFAAKGIINFDITIEQPRVGKQLSYEATLPETSKACVTKVEWDGKLDSNCKIIAGESYTVRVYVGVKDGVTDYQIFKLSSGKIQVNKNTADLVNISKDKQKAVVTYTFGPISSDPFDGMKSVSSFNLSATRPMEGNALDYTSVERSSSTKVEVTKVDWKGELDANGRVKKDTQYTVSITVRVKDSYPNYYIKAKEGNPPKVDGKSGEIASVSADGQEAVITCTFKSEAKPVVEEPKEEVKEQPKEEPKKEQAPKTDKVPGTIKQTPFTFEGGSGTAADPYLIKTADQLNSIRFGADKHYKLISDIDLSAWGNWVPIGGTEAYGGTMGDQWNKAHIGSVVFTGSLDGNGHVISGMTIKIHDVALYMTEGSNVRYYGLFARVNADGTVIKNLGIINHTIDLEYESIPQSMSLCIGSIASLVTKGNIENCFSAGGNITVKTGKPFKKDSNVTIEVGGLVGNHHGSFSRCYNTSDIYINAAEAGLAYGAGIAATVSYAQVKECYNKGNITVVHDFENATFHAAAGIAVKAELGDTPGIRGLLPEDANSFYDCYNTGNLSANAVSGIIHYTGWDVYVYRSYNTGNLSCHSMAANGANHIINKWCAIYTDTNPARYIVGCATEGGTKVSGDAWQNSTTLGRPVLKWNPTEAVPNSVSKNDGSVGKFTDVKTSDWFAEPVKWAVDKSITNGTAPDKFSPNDKCTRAQILTFLWRAVGSPKVEINNPFSDVKSSDYFYYPALWAYKNGIVSNTKLSPNTPCTRGETVIYLYKSAGSPESDQINQFIDVPASDVALNRAVCWAYVNNITGGTSYTTFSPKDTCTRGQIVTFLYRAFK